MKICCPSFPRSSVGTYFCTAYVVGFLMAGSLALAESWEAPSMTLTPFPLDCVRLLDGPCKTAQEANRAYLHALDADRLLYMFRVTAGLDAPGEPLGGWEKPDCEVRGHFVGHYLSACALMYASAGDEELKRKADAMVAELAKCQAANGEGYLSAYPKDFWDRLEAMKQPPWAPYYTIHKIMAGLYDMYALCGNKQALGVLDGMASYFKKRTDALSIYQWDQILGVEFGGMSEVLHNLYAVTGNPDHLALAHKFDRASFLGPLALEHDDLSRIHANTHIPEIVGAARRYEILGDPRYQTITEFFWDCVVGSRIYATGGTSNAEHWPDPGKLAATLSIQNQESCTSYNMLRVTRHLIGWTGDPRYADYYERTYFNSILGSQDPRNGMLAYFIPLAAGNAKVYGTPNDAFWCCYGTGIESFSKLGDSIYFHDDAGVYVNLYVASKLDWKERDVRIEQQTRFPEEEGATFVVHVKQPTKFALNLRVPYWTQGAQATVNGKVDAASCRVDAARCRIYIEREWRDGDRVELRLPMALRAEAMPDDPHVVAAMYGPVVLAGLCESKRYFMGDPADVSSWLEKVPDKPLHFRTKGQSPDIDLVPLNQIVDERYGVYWEIIEKGSARHNEILAEEAEQRKLEARVVDRVTPEEAVEKTHNLQGDKTQNGPHQNRWWRHAPDGWFSWDLRVLPNVPMTLRCLYWGDDVPPRTFDILVNDTMIATQSLNHDKPGEYFSIDYAIPPELTKSKDHITVRFNAHEGNTAGGVFECTILKPAE